jgi:hypothetical protein
MKVSKPITEHAIQAAVVKYIRTVRPNVKMTATLGGVKMSVKQMAKAKSDGYECGIPDLLVFAPSGNCVGLCIEFKKPKVETWGDGQEAWYNYMLKQGWDANRCNNEADGKRIVNQYFGIGA